MIDIKNYKKHRTVCKTCYNKNKRKNNINILPPNKISTSYQPPSIENVNKKKKLKNNNNKDNVSKTYYMLKKLEKIGNQRPIHIIIRSLNRNPNYKTNNEIKPININKGSVLIFDDMLGARNSSQKDDFFTRGRHEDLDVHYNSQSYFGLPRQSIRHNSDTLILFKETLRDVQSVYQDIGAFDKKSDDFKEICRVAWREKFNYLCIDMTKKKNESKSRIFNETKTKY